MTPSTAMIICGDSPNAESVIWNQVASVRFLVLIDQLRDEVANAINAALAAEEQPPHDPSLDYGTRP